MHSIQNNNTSRPKKAPPRYSVLLKPLLLSQFLSFTMILRHLATINNKYLVQYNHVKLIFRVAAGQNEDIPIENDNQFPPDTDGAVIEGSGDETVTVLSGIVDIPVPLMEEVLPGNENGETTTIAQEDQTCPKSCLCHFEGATENFVVDCSGNGLTEFPLPLDSKVTSLNIQNNKITEIPKDIATLTNLKVLNADNNAIMDLALGVSIHNVPNIFLITEDSLYSISKYIYIYIYISVREWASTVDRPDSFQ